MGWTSQVRWDRTNRVHYCRVGGQKQYLSRDYATACRKFAELVQAGPALPKGLTVSEAVEAWLAHQGKGDKSWEAYRLRQWEALAGGEMVGELAATHLADLLAWLRRQGRAGWTIRHEIRLARRVLCWCKERGAVADVPQTPKMPRGRRSPKDLPPSKVKAALDRMGAPARRILTFVALTGARPGEAVGLRWDQVDLEHHECVIPEHKAAGRTGSPRVLYLSPAALALIQEVRTRRGVVFRNSRGKPYTVAGLRTIVRRYGLTTTYRLRHTRAQTMLDAGHDIADVAAYLGHADLRTVEVYAQVRDRRLRAVAEALDAPWKDSRAADTPAGKASGRRAERRVADQRTRGRRGTGRAARSA